MKFVKGFEHIVVLTAVITFRTHNHIYHNGTGKKTPCAYTIQTVDNHGEKIILPDLRVHFRRYEVAESYARFYRDMYRQQQYKFRVIGLKK